MWTPAEFAMAEHELALFVIKSAYPNSKVHGANMGPIWGQQDPGGSHVGPMKFAIWVVYAGITTPVFVDLLIYYSCVALGHTV